MMKRLFILSFAIFAVSLCFDTVFATFPSGQLGDTIDIEADFSSQGSTGFEFNLKNISDNQPTETINWDTSLVSFGISDPQWLWSTTYAVVKATITENTKIYMYQTNTESTKYVANAARTVNVYYENGYNKDNDPDGLHITSTTYAYNGLVNEKTKGGEYNGFVALSFMFIDSQLPSSSSEFKNPYNPEVMLENKVSRYFTDKQDYVIYKATGEKKSNFKIEYSQIAGFGGPVFGVYNESGEYAPWRPTLVDNTAYMYFGGNFMNITHGDVFGTDQIIIEQYVE